RGAVAGQDRGNRPTQRPSEGCHLAPENGGEYLPISPQGPCWAKPEDAQHVPRLGFDVVPPTGGSSDRRGKAERGAGGDRSSEGRGVLRLAAVGGKGHGCRSN